MMDGTIIHGYGKKIVISIPKPLFQNVIQSAFVSWDGDGDIRFLDTTKRLP